MKRPWNLVANSLRGAPNSGWGFIGCISFEDRFDAVVRQCADITAKSLWFKFQNQKSSAAAEISARLSEHDLKLVRRPDWSYTIRELQLLGNLSAIDESFKELLGTGIERLIIDISCLPKAVFFPLLRFALNAPQLKDLVIGYSIPESYAEGPLAGELNPMMGLPGMMPETLDAEKTPKLFIASVGYLPFDVQELEQQFGGQTPIEVIFPFPSTSPAYRRNWGLMQQLFSDENAGDKTPLRVDARDMSRVYDIISDLDSKTDGTVLLLPFGPKPHAAAMAIRAIQKGHEVFYTQPKYYNPNYSTGVKKHAGGDEESYGYWVKCEGALLYES
jgi:hypothetical protein